MNGSSLEPKYSVDSRGNWAGRLSTDIIRIPLPERLGGGKGSSKVRARSSDLLVGHLVSVDVVENEGVVYSGVSVVLQLKGALRMI